MKVGELRARLADYPADMEVMVSVDDSLPFPTKNWSTDYPVQRKYPTGAFLLGIILDDGSRVMLLDRAEVERVEKERNG